MFSNRSSSRPDVAIVMVIILLAIGATRCGQSPHSTALAPAKDSTTKTSSLSPVGDSLQIPGFSIRLQLSAQANAALSSKHETIIVHAWFNGKPKDTTTAEFRESGEKFLCEKKMELDTARTAFVQGALVSKKQVDALANVDIHVLVNVYSGRRVIAENMLDCDIIDAQMSQVKGKMITLPCKLIGESDSLPTPPTPGYTPSGQPPLAPPRVRTK